MAASVQDALADVALRLASLKATLSDKQVGADREAGQLLAIQRMAAELEALLHPQQAAPADQSESQAPQHGTAADQEAQPNAAAPAKVAGLPATPFDQRRGPAAGPSTAAKPPAPTPGGGLPATTPLAAEVLASLNFLGSSNDAAAAARPDGEAPAAAAAALRSSMAVDQEDGDAAATLSGLFGGLEPRASGAASTCPAPQQAQQEQPLSALASLLQEASLAPPQHAMHSVAMAAAAAAAAAGPAMPVSRRQSSALLPSIANGGGSQPRPCNCKRSMCLKMYCECFAGGGFCAPSCSCHNCSNTPAEVGAVQAAREVVLAKNPHAFEVKVTAAEGHKRGCRCKRSKCLKKYCECFHAGARCNPDVCQCEDCRNTEGDAMLGGSLLVSHQSAALQHQMSWADASADVLAMFQQPLPMGGAAEALSGGSSGARRSRAAAQHLPLPPPMPLPLPSLMGGSAGFPFAALPPMPEPAFNSAAAVLGAFQSAAQPAPFDPSAAAAAFMLNPVAAAAAATIAAAATLAEQQQQHQLEESMAEAVSCPVAVAGTGQAAGAAAAVATATPKVVSALTSHLSDMAGPADSEMHDTATSPAPHMTVAKLAARVHLAVATAGPTLTGGAAGPLGRPPLPSSRVRSRAASPDSHLSLGSADENGGDSCNIAGSLRSKRPRRAASGGVLGAVAAEASEWGLEMVSPPLKRANSLPAGLEQGNKGAGNAGGRGKVSNRQALLKKALVGETAAAAAAAAAVAGKGGPRLPALLAQAECAVATTAEDEDAISALFELSSSMC